MEANGNGRSGKPNKGQWYHPKIGYSRKLLKLLGLEVQQEDVVQPKLKVQSHPEEARPMARASQRELEPWRRLSHCYRCHWRQKARERSWLSTSSSSSSSSFFSSCSPVFCQCLPLVESSWKPLSKGAWKDRAGGRQWMDLRASRLTTITGSERDLGTSQVEMTSNQLLTMVVVVD